MAALAEEKSSFADTLKLFAALVILVAAIYGFYEFAEQSILYRVIGMIVAVILAGFVAYTSSIGKAFWSFASDARVEVKKSCLANKSAYNTNYDSCNGGSCDCWYFLVDVRYVFSMVL